MLIEHPVSHIVGGRNATKNVYIYIPKPNPSKLFQVKL